VTLFDVTLELGWIGNSKLRKGSLTLQVEVEAKHGVHSEAMAAIQAYSAIKDFGAAVNNVTVKEIK